MIITRLVIDNYKQYRGECNLEIAEDATIGVVGANGVGKTTLFEAIEWCLYNPRSIENKHIRPRGTGGEVRVVVQLTTNTGDAVYEVERVLKRSGTQATVYRMNELGSDPVVQGTREVTDYISTRLIGMGHSAFVATFFTRQKELSFFGDLAPSARRREVGKLLGFETIKQAQALIANDRTSARHDAESLQRQYDAKTEHRNLKEEMDTTRTMIAERRAAMEAAQATLKQEEARTSKLEQELQAMQDKRDRFHTASAELRDLETRLEHATARATSLSADLEYLDRRGDERGRLAVLAAEEPSLRAERKRLETERERFQARERLQRDIEDNQRRITSSRTEAKQLVERTPGPSGITGWEWSREGENDPVSTIERLVGIASAIDPSTTEQRLDAFRTALFEHQCIERETATLQRYRARQAQVRQELDTLMRDGEPGAVRSALEARQADARRRQSDAKARMSALMKQRDTTRELVTRLEHQHFEDACPTCGRAFSDREAEVVISTLWASVRQHESDIAATAATARDAENELKQLAKELQQTSERERSVQELRARYDNSLEYITQQETTVNSHTASFEAARKLIDHPTAPTEQDIAIIEREVQQQRALRETTRPLGMLRRSIVEAQQAIGERRIEMETLSDIAWEPDHYQKVAARHDEASRAASAIDQIDRELARRPQLEHDLASARATASQLETSIAAQRTARDAIGFDADALQVATASLREARSTERKARENLHESDNAARDATRQLEMLEREEADIRDLAKQAEDKRRLREELDLMYTEFSEFDKFVAQRVSPQLSDTTSDIVAEMTDGKYDRVVFNEDYGIEVCDESGDRFALETFSGGERDAIALAARLALSRLIGSQASNPPGFLVLDEVFGSLDAERRERVLTLLGQHAHEYFRQMFVISHIDDVQQSPVFDAVWRISQLEDGSSHVLRNPDQGDL